MSTFTDKQQEKIREEVKEHFFKAGNNILRPIVQELNEVYPSSKRLQRSTQFDQAIFDEHDAKFRRARNHLYEQRNLVQKKWLPRYIIKNGGAGDPVATTELRLVIVDGALDRLYETLVAYIPMLVPAEKSKALQETVGKMFAFETKQLKDTMEKYTATFAPEVASMDSELE